jgi:hypothetical protein
MLLTRKDAQPYRSAGADSPSLMTRSLDRREDGVRADVEDDTGHVFESRRSIVPAADQAAM